VLVVQHLGHTVYVQNTQMCTNTQKHTHKIKRSSAAIAL